MSGDGMQMAPRLGYLVLTPEEITAQEKAVVIGSLGPLLHDAVNRFGDLIDQGAQGPAKVKRTRRAAARTAEVVTLVDGADDEPFAGSDDDEPQEEDEDELPPLVPNIPS